MEKSSYLYITTAQLGDVFDFVYKNSVLISTNSRLLDVYSHSSIYRIFYLFFSYFIKKGCTVRQTTSHCLVLTVISDKKAQNVRQITASSLPVTDNDSI